MTQPGVSRAVAALERELGVTLVIRGHKGVRLTAQGELALEHARAVMGHTRRLTEEAAAARECDRGRLRVAAAPSAARLLAPLVEDLAGRLPDTAVVVLEGSDGEVAGRGPTGRLAVAGLVGASYGRGGRRNATAWVLVRGVLVRGVLVARRATPVSLARDPGHQRAESPAEGPQPHR